MPDQSYSGETTGAGALTGMSAARLGVAISARTATIPRYSFFMAALGPDHDCELSHRLILLTSGKLVFLNNLSGSCIEATANTGWRRYAAPRNPFCGTKRRRNRSEV